MIGCGTKGTWPKAASEQNKGNNYCYFHQQCIRDSLESVCIWYEPGDHTCPLALAFSTSRTRFLVLGKGKHMLKRNRAKLNLALRVSVPATWNPAPPFKGYHWPQVEGKPHLIPAPFLATQHPVPSSMKMVAANTPSKPMSNPVLPPKALGTHSQYMDASTKGQLFKTAIDNFHWRLSKMKRQRD